MMTGRDGAETCCRWRTGSSHSRARPPARRVSHVRDGGIYIDATFGAGGYTRAILAAADCRVIGIDRDQQRDRARRRSVSARRTAG